LQDITTSLGTVSRTTHKMVLSLLFSHLRSSGRVWRGLAAPGLTPHWSLPLQEIPFHVRRKGLAASADRRASLDNQHHYDISVKVAGQHVRNMEIGNFVPDLLDASNASISSSQRSEIHSAHHKSAFSCSWETAPHAPALSGGGAARTDTGAEHDGVGFPPTRQIVGLLSSCHIHTSTYTRLFVRSRPFQGTTILHQWWLAMGTHHPFSLPVTPGPRYPFWIKCKIVLYFIYQSGIFSSWMSLFRGTQRLTRARRARTTRRLLGGDEDEDVPTSSSSSNP
jgi:hypothetical protein